MYIHICYDNWFIRKYVNVLRLRCKPGGYHWVIVGGLTLTPLSYIYTHLLYLDMFFKTRAKFCSSGQYYLFFTHPTVQPVRPEP